MTCTQIAPAQPPEDASSDSTNLAVARCCDAYTTAMKAASARGKGQVFATLDAEKAYRSAMPPLSGYENIRDFIACTAHAMLIGAIDGANGTRLLYAAQVAATLVPKPSPTKSASRKRDAA